MLMVGETNIYAIGDCCNTSEEKLAAHACAHARTVAHNIWCDIKGKTKKTYRQSQYLFIYLSHILNFTPFFLPDARASPMMTILLGTVSVFLPNGYLLYNFAATFLCDFTFDQSKKYLFFHMLAVTTEFCLCVGIIWIGQVQEWSFIVENIPSNSVLQGQ